MSTLIPSTARQRRSERVSIAFGLEVTGMDSSGKRFSESAKTRTVSRYGCCVALPHALAMDQRLKLRRLGTGDTAVGRIVAPMGMEGGLQFYGVGTARSCESLWGIRFSSSLHGKILNSMQDGLSSVDSDRQITYWNAAAEYLTGYSATEAIGMCCFDEFLAHQDEHGTPLCGAGCPLSEALSSGQSSEKELFLRHKDGHRIPVTVRVLPTRNQEGEVVGALELFSALPIARKLDHRVHELAQLAFRDPLTELPNRRFLEMKVAQALEECRSFGRSYGLLMFDLDRFKQVNDSYGHNAGDGLLKTTARALAEGLRPGDIVGRWGGEEFLVVMPDVNAVALGDLAERCRILIAGSEIKEEDHRISVTASIGATVLNAEETSESAIHRVDQLMYESKRNGGDRTTAG